jgi:hypothetical protein
VINVALTLSIVVVPARFVPKLYARRTECFPALLTPCNNLGQLNISNPRFIGS